MGNDKEIACIERVLGGDTEAFGCLIERYGDSVFALVSGMVRVREDAEEITSDVFMKAYTQLHRFRGESKFSTWLYRIAYNTAISFIRRKRPYTLNICDERLEAADDSTDYVLLKETDLENLEAGLEKLNGDERAMLDMFYIEKMSIEEIAVVVSLSGGNVKVKLHRLRRKLAAIITDNKKHDNE